MQQMAGLENARRSTELRPRRMLRWVLLAATCLVVLALLGMYGSTVYFIHKPFTRRVQACKTVPGDLGLKAGSAELCAFCTTPRLLIKKRVHVYQCESG
jgi:hypothetical protein